MQKMAAVLGSALFSSSRLFWLRGYPVVDNPLGVPAVIFWVPRLTVGERERWSCSFVSTEPGGIPSSRAIK
jgi:hypothetical protein